MPEIRVRTNGIGGTVDNADAITGGVGLTAAGTTLMSEALAAAPVITAGQHWPIVLDMDAELGLPPEIAWVTAHTAGATTATIARGQETWAGGVAARAHLRDINWAHVLTMCDLPGSPGGMGVVGFTAHSPAANYSTPSTSAVAIDASNVKVPFLAPPTGKVLVSFQTVFQLPNTASLWIGVHDGTSLVKEQKLGSAATSGLSLQLDTPVKLFVSGLTPGSSKIFTVYWRVNADTGWILAGSQQNEIIIEVSAVNF